MKATEPEEKTSVARADAEREWRILRRILNALRTYISRLLQVSEERKRQIYTETFRASEITDLNYWLEIIFSLGIATLGLIISSPAVVIGAMLISPLMGPIFGLGLALALGDFYLGIKSLLNLVLSILASILLAAFLTWMLPFRTPTPEILARVQPTMLDLGVAVLSGLAGAVVVCRGGKGGGVTALPGVAVAVALMPPLGVVGFGVGIGWDWTIVKGSGLLFLTNLVAIILSSFLVFFAVRMDAPSVRREINEWVEEQKKTEAFYEFIDRTPLRRLLGRVGSLPRRMIILVVFLALVALPLQSTFQRLRDEAQIRRVVTEELHKSIPRESIFREDLEIAPDRLRLRVVAVLPAGFSAEQRRNLEEVIRSQTGRPAQVVVFAVATREDLTQLASRAGPLPLESLEEIRVKLLARVQPAVASAWPGDQAPLVRYDISFDGQTGAPTIGIAYLSAQELGELGEEAVRRVLRERIGSSALQARFQRIPPDTRLAFRPATEFLSHEGASALDQLAAVLVRYPSLRCALVPPAQEGKEPSALDKRRAEKVRKYLIEQGKIAPARFSIQPGPGERDSLLLRLLTAQD